MCLGGVLCGRVVYCVVGWCSVWKGCTMCGRVVYCAVGVYCVVGRCSVR